MDYNSIPGDMQQPMYPWIQANPTNYRPLAMVNITVQPQITNVYNPQEALRRGTLFPELYKPFMGSRGDY